MCDRFGAETYVSALDALLERNHRAMKTLLGMIFADGETLEFSDYICDDGVGFGPVRAEAGLTRTGDKVHLDFSGSARRRTGRSTTTSTRTS